MNYVLGIDTSSIELGVGLARGTEPVMAISRYLRNSHAEHIAQCVDFLLKANNISAADITYAGIAVGPGSFTGLRIGIAFLKGFFLGRETSVLQVSSLESVAGSWHVDGRDIVSASDARNGQVFWARFHKAGGATARLTPDALVTAQEFRSAVKDSDIVLTDALGYAKSVVFNFLKDRPDAFSVEDHPLQRGLSSAMLAARKIKDAGAWRKAGDIVPEYLSSVPFKKEKE
ncbi:MAG TPA: tRNA (adenosine(37)-N6)-threonylcarbamoyltransferase complex dimerization subunit type 1 TsaB [Chitinivibrionales bacterium]|nr:tRNA (adenosine(37)-N6)-threonylcarbamoyltransferase complex dimerization subunit type 1 TsaB [Chitinivibrionales bacterium]